MGAQAASVEVALAPLHVSFRRDTRIFLILAVATAAAGLALLWNRTLARPVPLGLSVHERAGQLRIGWSRVAASRGATLEIIDGRQHTTMFVAAPLADVTYAARTTDVKVRLRIGDSRTEIARYLVQEPSFEELDAGFAAVLAEVREVRALIRRQRARVADLQSAAEDLAGRIAALHPPGRRGKQPARTTVWWR